MKNWLIEERQLVIAFVILFLLTVFMAMVGMDKVSPTQIYGIADFLIAFATLSTGLLSIRYIRGKEKPLKQPPYGVSHLTVWATFGVTM